MRQTVRRLKMAMIVAAVIGAGCARSRGQNQISRSDAISVAQTRAAELGYSVDKMRVEVRRTGKAYVVTLLPPVNPGSVGGDITVIVNDRGGVTKTLQGQ